MNVYVPIWIWFRCDRNELSIADVFHSRAAKQQTELLLTSCDDAKQDRHRHAFCVASDGRLILVVLFHHVRQRRLCFVFQVSIHVRKQTEQITQTNNLDRFFRNLP